MSVRIHLNAQTSRPNSQGKRKLLSNLRFSFCISADWDEIKRHWSSWNFSESETFLDFDGRPLIENKVSSAFRVFNNGLSLREIEWEAKVRVDDEFSRWRLVFWRNFRFSTSPSISLISSWSIQLFIVLCPFDQDRIVENLEISKRTKTRHDRRLLYWNQEMNSFV